MEITGINLNANISGGSPAGTQNPQLRSLEQKLQKLTEEKKEALANKDTDKVKALEKEIQNVKRQIQQLKEKQKKEKQTEEEQEKGPEQPEQIASNHILDHLA